MNYIIFGCGDIGKQVLERVGESNVLYFADNYHNGETVCGKRVLSFPEAERICREREDVLLLIASNLYWREMEAQVRAAGLRKYLVFHDLWPGYMVNRVWKTLSYEQAVKNFSLSSYRRVGIYFLDISDAFLLALELQKHNPEAEITMIPAEEGGDVPDFFSFQQMSLDAAPAQLDCLCITMPRNEDPAAIRDRFFLEPPSCDIADLYAADRFEPAFHYDGLEKYKDIHKGKRIFIIGNGPSLRMEDLNTLHEHREICIASNKIYKAYRQTEWRADYIGFTDWIIIKQCAKYLLNIPGHIFLADNYHSGTVPYMEGIQYFHQFWQTYYPNFPGFSEDFTTGFYNGMTVTYDFGIQLAAYMGASQMFLIGVDNSFVGSVTDSGNHFCPDYFSECEKEEFNVFEPEKLTKAYEKAELYSRKHGFRIYNATRGGKLEVFERVDFDSLF